jgi:hypothetical protein
LIIITPFEEEFHKPEKSGRALMGGLIPLGIAMDQTGTAQWLAKEIVTGLGTTSKSEDFWRLSISAFWWR